MGSKSRKQHKFSLNWGIRAYEYLLKNKNAFSIDKGFELLKSVAYQDPDCSTLCSMIFHPQTNNVYIVLHQDYEKIWKISMQSGVIATYKGFDKHHQIRLGPEGVLAKELESVGS